VDSAGSSDPEPFGRELRAERLVEGEPRDKLGTGGRETWGFDFENPKKV